MYSLTIALLVLLSVPSCISVQVASKRLKPTRSSSGSFPNGPWHVQESRIHGADGGRVTYAGVNWPGAEATMVPEGLQYQSIHDIVAKIKSLGMNAVRLTYATEMIDQIYDNGMKDVLVGDSFVRALGQANGTFMFGKVLEKNPTFARNITHIQVSGLASLCPCLLAHLDAYRVLREHLFQVVNGLPGIRRHHHGTGQKLDLRSLGQPYLQSRLVLYSLGR